MTMSLKYSTINSIFNWKRWPDEWRRKPLKTSYQPLFQPSLTIWKSYNPYCCSLMRNFFLLIAPLFSPCMSGLRVGASDLIPCTSVLWKRYPIDEFILLVVITKKLYWNQGSLSSPSKVASERCSWHFIIEWCLNCPSISENEIRSSPINFDFIQTFSRHPPVASNH